MLPRTTVSYLPKTKTNHPTNRFKLSHETRSHTSTNVSLGTIRGLSLRVSGFGTSNCVHSISVIEPFQAGLCVSGDIGTVEKSQVVLHDSTLLHHPAAPISIYDMRGYPLAARLSCQSVTQSVSYCRCRFTFPICEASSPPPPPPAGGFALIYSAAGGRDVTSP